MVLLTPGVARRVRLLLRGEAWRRRIVFWCGGLSVGIAAVVLAIAADYVQAWFRALMGVSPYLALVITPAGIALSVALTRRYFPGSQGSGIPQAIAARRFDDAASRNKLLALRLAGGKIVLTLLGLLAGASTGREGPTVQVGASVMHAVGRVWVGKHQGLILAGSAAGVAAAFNTPLAGIVFAIEEMSRSFEQRTSGLVLSAVIIAGIASLSLLGNYTYFGHTGAMLAQPEDWVAVPLAGVCGGLLGGLFSKIVVMTAKGLPGRAGALAQRYPVGFAALCGLAVAVIGILAGGTTYGTGYDQAKALVEGAGHVPQSFGILKFLATTLSTVSGIPGGIFSPSLAVGAGLGANIAALLPGTAVGAVILLGMVGYFAGVVQAPITAFVIVLEMTESHAMTVPLMLTALIAYGTARFIGAPPIYHALAESFLPRDR
ncbi:MAG TPA: chloride channel protein [Stellaceae bacterium]|jgi:H+/Cl- antiporter ClcA|nr:chloride channel protein [Stellaceae bacterium]